MARLIIKGELNQPTQSIELKAGVNRFGRTPENDHMLPDVSVSEEHCEILLDGEFIFIRDLGSTNGTFIDGKRVVEAALYPGQILKIGPVEFTLDAPAVRLHLPELPKPELEEVVVSTTLPDGYPSCPNHTVRHAVWECTFCQRIYCDECIRKLRRVGGVQLKLCSVCSNPCRLTAWSEMMRGKKQGIFGKLVDKLKDGLTKRTTKPL